MENNAYWLKGNWHGEDTQIEFKPIDKNYRVWQIKKGKGFIIKKGEVTVQSSKNNIIICNDDESVHITVYKLNRNNIRITILQNGIKILDKELTNQSLIK